MTTGSIHNARPISEDLSSFELTAPEAPPIGRPKIRGTCRRKLVHRVFHAPELLALRSRLGNSSSDCDGKVLALAKKLSPSRDRIEFGKTPAESFFVELRARFPHMREPIDLFSDMAALSTAANTGYQVSPVLLEGPPGVGKTAFAQTLARAIGTKLEILDMAGLTAGFILAGSDPSWSMSRQGRIFDLLTEPKALANPVVVLDEIDKLGGDKRYDPCGPLYSLLEPCSARSFKDEFIPLTIDASAIIWIATCNCAADVPMPILSRFDRYYIESPSADAWAAIAQSIWTDLLAAKTQWAKILAPTLAKNVIARLVEPGDAREITRLLVRAAARAAKAKRPHLIPEDIGQTHKSGKRRPIGFT